MLPPDVQVRQGRPLRPEREAAVRLVGEAADPGLDGSHPVAGIGPVPGTTLVAHPGVMGRGVGWVGCVWTRVGGDQVVWAGIGVCGPDSGVLAMGWK